MGEGFIPLGRSFFSHHFWEEKRVFSRAEAWVDLISEAAWKERKKVVSGKVIEVPRGGIVAAVRFLSDRWKWSNTKVCQFLEILRLDGMITTEKRQGITIVLLTNYERFNPAESAAKTTPKRQKNDGEATPKRQKNDETEEGKEGEKGKESEADASLQAGASLSAFDRFWTAYPRREGKSEARSSFAKVGAEQFIDTVLAAVERQKASPQWTKDDGEFIPHPKTWLNQKRWEDEGITPPPKKRRYDN